MLVRPEQPCSPLIATVAIDTMRITAQFPTFHDAFVTVMRGLDYRWNRPVWERTITPQWNGPPADRAVEVGHTLLQAGFIIDMPDETLAQRAQLGDYAPEIRRWVRSRTSKNDTRDTRRFWIRWGRAEDYYQQARRLPGSRYVKPGILVPADAYLAVQDFAEMYGFALSPGAQQLIADAASRYESALIAAPAPVVEPDTDSAALAPAPPDLPPDIHPDLRDEDCDDLDNHH